jgi:hypothetical protein
MTSPNEMIIGTIGSHIFLLLYYRATCGKNETKAKESAKKRNFVI